MILDVLKKFIENECPLVSGKKIKVNYLGEKPQSYTVDTVPANPVVRKYPDGGSLRQYLFVFASREFYDAQVWSNLDVMAFYEAFSDWIDEVNRTGALPDLGDGLCARRLEVLSSGYLFKAESDDARYQIQCKLLYEKEGVFHQ